MASTAGILVPIAPGELIDKITILEIKSARIDDAAKLANVEVELRELSAVREASVPPEDRVTALTAALKTVNETLWEVEDDLREHERNGDFGPRFVELARAVYKTNDRRAALKREINVLLGSAIVEEKSYAAY